jgi:outer membrane protein insertion porin family
VSARAAIAAIVVLLAGCPGGTQKPTGPTGPTGNEAPPAKIVPGVLADLAGEVVDIEIAGVADDRQRAAKNALVTRVGATFAVATVAQDIRALWQIAGIADVQVSGRLVGRGVAVRYTLRELPNITAIQVNGATAIATDEIIEEMPVRRGYPIDPGAFNQYKQALVDRYRELGFARATVEWETVRRDDGADVVFTIVEGPPVEIAKIELRGNKKVKRQDLLDQLAKDGGPKVGGRYWELALERGLLYVSALYYDLGYINVRVEPPEITPSADGSSVAIVISIREDAQYKIGKIAYKGVLVVTEAEYTKRLGIKTGDVFNRSKLNEGMDRLVELQKSKGKADATVVPLTEIDAVKKRVNLTFEIL